MVKRRRDDAAIRAWADAVLAGKSTPIDVAREAGVTPQAARAWVRKRREELSGSTSNTAIPSDNRVLDTPSPSPSSSPLVDDAARVEAARRAGGIGPASASHPAEGARVDPFAGKTPQEIRDGLLSTCEGVNFMLLRAASVFYRSPVNVEELSKLSKSEREFLGQFANSAAPYVALLIAHADKIGAAVFFVGYGFSLFGKLSTTRKEGTAAKVREMEEKKRAEEARAQSTKA